MSNRLAGKVALITGGASGIGAATARTLAAQGAAVVIGDVDTAAAERLADELGGAAGWVRLDVTDEASWAAAVAAVEERCGRMNVLVNNAGIGGQNTVEDLTLESWDRTMSINLTGPMLGIRASIPALRRAAPASIINMCSIAGLIGFADEAAYTVSKFGVRGLTKTAALHLSDSGIRVNSVHPGLVDTPLTRDSFGENAESMAQSRNSRERLSQPEEIAALVAFLASDESSYSSGAEFVVDGGITAGLV